MKWMLSLLVALLLFAAAASYWALQKRSEKLCQSAQSLAAHALTVSHWLEEATQDPFLGPEAFRGAAQSVLREYRIRVRAIASDVSAPFLPERTRNALLTLERAAEGSADLAAALKALPPAAAELRCIAPERPAPEDLALAQNVEAGTLFWGGRRAMAILERQEFAEDREIYCRSELLLRGLKRLVESANSVCKGAAQGSKLKKACMGDKGGVSGNMDGEIVDLQQQKEFNMHKLQQKWPERVLKELEC